MQEQYSVGIYARLSRDDERAGESVSIENQKEMLARYVLEQGWTLYDYYCDDGVSGTTFDRPGFNRLVQDATDRKINLVLTKDLSRLGRDYIEAGKYTDFIFPSLGCRFIALNDGVDTIRKNNEMLVILKNVMNDLYARDTSNKIKAVKLSTFKAGKYVGCYAPLGYRKSAADKHILEIDPVTAPVVRHIFDLRLQGNGFRKIALILNAEKVPAPRTFYYMAEGRENHRGETPFWNDVTVKTILRNEVYLGHMVQNKTGTVSYKNHKQVSKPESEWIRVENTHEPLISQDVWDACSGWTTTRPEGAAVRAAAFLCSPVCCGAWTAGPPCGICGITGRKPAAKSRSTRHMSATGTLRAAKTPVLPTTSTRRHWLMWCWWTSAASRCGRSLAGLRFGKSFWRRRSPLAVREPKRSRQN